MRPTLLAIRVATRAVVHSAVVVLLVACPSTAAAYDRAGHFYASAAVAADLCPGLSAEEDALLAFCAQLPDEVDELDAVALYRQATFLWVAYRWNPFTGAWSDDFRRMVTVQQLLHGLTGGVAESLQTAAEATVVELAKRASSLRGQDRANGLCALGFALHLYGDSFAHVTLDPPTTGQWRMYSTGRGHARDAHFPDYPLFEPYADRTPRWDAWMRYIEHEPTHLQGSWRRPTDLRKLLDDITHLRHAVATAWFGFGDYGEDQVRSSLLEFVPGEHALRTIAAAVANHWSRQPCQAFVDETFLGKHGGVAVGCAPSCKDSWDLFRGVSAKMMARSSQAITDWPENEVERLDPALGAEGSSDGTHGSCAAFVPQLPEDCDRALPDPSILPTSTPPPIIEQTPPATPSPSPLATPPTAYSQCCTPTPSPTPSPTPTEEATPSSLPWPLPESSSGHLIPDIHFETGVAVLTPAAKAILELWVTQFLADPSLRIVATGHTDQRGSRPFNMSLGQDRANSVKSFLTDHKVASNRILTASRGFDDPVCPDPEAMPLPLEKRRCWAQNRRVHILLGP